MSKRKRITLTRCIGTLLVSSVLAACSHGGSDKTAPKVPNRICWGAFPGDEVRTLLKPGSQLSVEAKQPFDLYSGKVDTSCIVYIDGNTGFLAAARRFDSYTSWGFRKEDYDSRIQVGQEGMLSDSGAASYFTCNRPANLPQDRWHPNSEKYIILQIDTWDSPGDPDKNRKALTSLMRKFVPFAQQKLRCQ
ncbi:hypothetical protein ACFV2X_48590 [Streptomyces sp. NPDC059679]|uniref:hypothetical protein n=1 Tax=Streptomyces sp. NPDC059679 TaxID=3346903 RepID=UPI0036CADC91